MLWGLLWGLRDVPLTCVEAQAGESVRKTRNWAPDLFIVLPG